MRFVLVEPQHPGNVGAAARALRNLGFDRLVLVAPQCDPLDAHARRMAVDARGLLERAVVSEDLDRALRGAATVVGTSARTGKHRKPHWRLDRLTRDAAFPTAGETAFVFGREAHGLTDAELDRCTHLVHFPSGEDYPSFNLAQAVLLAAYEMRLLLTEGAPPAGELVPAPHEEREPMYEHLERALRDIGFLSDVNAETMMRQLRRMLGRAGPTADEVKIMRGIARQARWAAGSRGQDR